MLPWRDSHLLVAVIAILTLSGALSATAGRAKSVAALDDSPFKTSDGQPRWTVRNGLTMALQPAAVFGKDEDPRGLIRIGRPLRPESTHPDLLNFIAVEPMTMDGRRGFSELEHSPSDGQQGIKFTCSESHQTKETLRLTIRCERFANGAHPYLIADFDARRPDEIRFEVHAEPDSAPMKMCILTATMGNYQRLRKLYLKNGSVLTDEALPRDPGAGFTDHAMFPLKDLCRDKAGVIVSANGTEDDPRILSNTLPKSLFWAYQGVNFTQFWRQPEPVDKDLVAIVNARKTYWMSETPLPGGKAFENFELNAAFHPGQVFIFGVHPPQPLTPPKAIPSTK